MTISVDELATKAMALSGEPWALLAEKLVESLNYESINIGNGDTYCFTGVSSYDSRNKIFWHDKFRRRLEIKAEAI